MSKIKLASLTLCMLALSITFGVQANYPFFAIAFVATVAFGLWFQIKRQRDDEILEQAKREREAAASTPEAPQQSSKGNHGMFVPPALDKHIEE